MSISVPAVNLTEQYQVFQTEIDQAIKRVLTSGWYILGQEVEAFEQEFAAYIGVEAGIGVANGTDALTLALLGVGVQPGDEVITVSHTAVATIVGIERAGARPVFVDIDPITFTLDPTQLDRALSPRTKAIVPVHLYGHPADMQLILPVARRHGLAVVEDCAQAHGATYCGQRVGALGDAATFSFYPTKNLGAVGDGGLVVTNHRTVAERVRVLREYGWVERYVSSFRGMNSRLDEVQAAILRAKLHYLDEWNQFRCSVAALYGTQLAGFPLTTPASVGDVLHAYHLYVVRVDQRDKIVQRLRACGVAAQIHYPVPVHLQPAYADLGFAQGSLPETERAAQTVLSLPIYPEMNQAAISHVVVALQNSLAH
jgi:dTDP-4-amino-4,6-dideoxygalactose transaminase